MKIITNKKALSKKCDPVSLEEGREIGERLLSFLGEHKNAVGLAANQVGINARVCVVNVERPLVFVNPVVVAKFGSVSFLEGCLSLPGQFTKTKRYKNIIVRDDLHGERVFDKNILEIICIQHEIDHLDGILMDQRSLDQK